MVTESAKKVHIPHADGRPPHPIPALLRFEMPPGCVISDEWLEQQAKANPLFRFELGHNGELIVNEGAGGDSPDISLEIGRQVGNWAVDGGGGRVRDSSGRYFVADIEEREALLLPDVSWVSPEQLAAVPPEQRRRTYRLCPAFVVEVRSPGDSLLAQQERMENWIHLGVRLGWLVDERGESVWIYRPGREPERQIRPKELTGEDVLEGLTVDCTRIWAMADDLASL